MQIQRAIITAAGKHQRSLPLQTLVDRDGETKTALTIIIEEVLAAGIEEIAIVVAPGDAAAFADAVQGHAGRLTFIEQAKSLGYGHAVWSAKSFAGDEAFLLLVSDHLYVTNTEFGCAAQLVEMARQEDCSVSAVQSTHESQLPNYGAVGGRLVAGRRGLYDISDVLEKPSPTAAEQQLLVPGLRAGHYLCFFGMHVLTPAVMGMLDEQFANAESADGVHLSAILQNLSRREQYRAFEVSGRRFDIGEKYGLLNAQMAIALAGQDRDEILVKLVELLASEKH